ncbi:MAG: single-stranded DNA-binding protein [Cyanobacteria bacterium]|nr:single-stranded DNA-binding protein [Cyanobacteriota bacterium]MDA1020104.1 single-stranded DNA-binding protein [Cyanobacteriota bacterium]
MSLSQATLSGTVKKNAEQKTTTNGNTVTSFTMDVLRYDSRAKEEKSYPVRVNLWGDNFADLAAQLTTGVRVIVSGRLQIDQFNSNDGKLVRLLTIEASRVALANKIASAGAAQTMSSHDPYSEPELSMAGSEMDAASEEVPF